MQWGKYGVGLGASGTFARPPGIASRFYEIFMPRMELKGWVIGCTRSGLRGVAMDEVMVMIVDLWTWRR